jgi:hypothetical protein
MRVTLIVEDNRVSVEGQSETVDCSSLADIHVVQWYGTSGEIEFLRTEPLKMNEQITDFAPYQKFVDAWTVEAKEESPVAS